MKKLFSPIALVLFAASVVAAPVDGRWQFSVPARVSKKNPQTAQPVMMVLNLKTDGNALSGTIAAAGRKHARAQTIRDGKIEGDKVSFTTVRKGKKGEATFLWSGVVQGDELKLTRWRQGAKQGAEITAKRQ